MKTLRTHLVIAVSMGLLAVAAIVTPQAAQATLMKTYTYTGNTFTSGGGSTSPSDFIAGSFTIDCGLLGGAGDCSSLAFQDYTSAVTGFSFSAAGATFDAANVVSQQFSFATDPSSDIISWDIDLFGPPIDGLFTQSISTAQDRFRSGSDFAQVTNNPGTWTVSAASVPEPPTLAILLVGLAALVLLLGRRRAGAAMAQEGRPVLQ